MTLAAYLDASAIVKLAVAEVESSALRTFLRDHESLVASSLVLVEVPQAVRRAAPSRLGAVTPALAGLELVPLDDELLVTAGRLDVGLRSLDAIHVASALELGDDLAALVTYDRRMAEAAEALGLPVVAPA